MTEAFKRLNAKVEALLQENTKLMGEIKSLKGKDSIRRLISITDLEKSFPSLEKMDGGVCIPQRMQKIPDRIIKIQTSPDQTVAVKTHQTPRRLVPDIEQNGPNTSPRNTNNNITEIQQLGEEDYGEHSYYQDAQNPNADDDSGMSFDSEALHNLDT
ncbi:hypothetical protein H5410_040317 [Solanum commersonii]|uniref:Uncharacterized protein n=1 Tax=Solanum commersonii TaxID=4109 RepID=A0A9J5XNI8_SOLCO|nr:hypothetical protein H5410_040317 [Solanum commersonii]